jgi:hypothetical protein
MFRWKLLAAGLCMAAYTAIVVCVLTVVGYWSLDLLKATLLWFFLSGIAFGFSALSMNETEPVHRRIIRDSVRVVIVVEFLVNTYTFSLPIELALIPALALVAMLDAVAQAREPGSPAAKLIRGVVVVAGLAIIAGAIHNGISQMDTLATTDSLKAIALAPILSILFIPCAIGLFLLSAYEQIFLRLDLGPDKDRSVLRYAHRRLFRTLGLRPDRVRSFYRDHGIQLMRVRTTADVDEILGRDT